jgi:hypothetical protein
MQKYKKGLQKKKKNLSTSSKLCYDGLEEGNPSSHEAVLIQRVGIWRK